MEQLISSSLLEEKHHSHLYISEVSLKIHAGLTIEICSDLGSEILNKLKDNR